MNRLKIEYYKAKKMLSRVILIEIILFVGAGLFICFFLK